MRSTVRQRLHTLRHQLLQQHKILLAIERAAYERAHESAVSNAEMLRLVLHDDQFAWLRPLSVLIVRIDEILDLDEQALPAEAAGLWQQASALFKPDAEPGLFGRRYYEALQHSPELAAMHAQLRRLLAGEG
jgi:hypothetical protein